MTICPDLGVRALADDDCVIHHDAKHDDKTEQTDHVYGHGPWPERH